MSVTPEISPLANRLAAVMDLDPQRAAALAKILDDDLTARLATRDQIDALDQRIETLTRQIEDSANVIVDSIGEVLAAMPARTRDTLNKDLQRFNRSLSDEISRLHSGSWIVLLAGMLFATLLSTTLARIL